MRFSTDLYQRDFSTISAELARSRTEVVHIVDQQVPQTPHLRYPETGTVGVNPFTVSDKALWTDGNTFVDEAGRRIEMALLERQRKVEGEQLEEAVKVYSENFDHMTKMGRGTHMKNTQRLLLGWYEPLVAAIYKEFESIAMGEKGIDRQVSSLCHAKRPHIVFLIYCFRITAIRSLSGAIARRETSSHHADDDAKQCSAQWQCGREIGRRCDGYREHVGNGNKIGTN